MNELHGLLREIHSVLRQRAQVRRWEWLLRVTATLALCLLLVGLADWSSRLHLLVRLMITVIGLPAVGYWAVRHWRPRWSVVERPVQLACRATRHPRLVGDVIAAMQFQAELPLDDAWANDPRSPEWFAKNSRLSKPTGENELAEGELIEGVPTGVEVTAAERTEAERTEAERTGAEPTEASLRDAQPSGTGGAAEGESRQLKHAVIRDVARRWDQIELSGQRLRLSRAGWGALGTLALCASLLMLAPGHSWAFAQRLVGLPAFYPTATQITELSLAERGIMVLRHLPQQAWVVRSEPARLVVVCAGEEPAQVTVELVGEANESTRLALTPLPDVGAAAADFYRYSVDLPPLNQSTQFRIVAGDAETRWAELLVRDRPRVTLQIAVTPPAYTGQASWTTSEPQVKVLAGSQVRMTLNADVPLAEVHSTWLTTAEVPSTRWQPVDKPGEQWQFPTEQPPLDVVLEAQRWQITAQSVAGISLAEPLRVELQLQPDESPTVEMGLEMNLVVPLAQPIVAYRARDDFGVQAVKVRLELMGRGSTTRTRELVLYERGSQPLQTVAQGEAVWRLADWGVTVGDRIQCTPLVTDYRHPLPGQTVAGVPFELRVGSEDEVLSEVMRGDEESQQLLDELIRVFTDASAEGELRETELPAAERPASRSPAPSQETRDAP